SAGSPVELDQRPRQRQTETSAVVAAFQPGIDLPEPLQRDRDLVPGHAGTAVLHLNCELVGSQLSRAHRNSAAGIAEFYRVREKVQQNLPEAPVIASDGRQIKVPAVDDDYHASCL